MAREPMAVSPPAQSPRTDPAGPGTWLTTITGGRYGDASPASAPALVRNFTDLEQ